MYEFYCDDDFQSVLSEARKARAAAVAAFWRRVVGRAGPKPSSIAANG